MFNFFKKIAIFFMILSLTILCRKDIELEKINDYSEFNKKAAYLTCEKIHICYNYIYRTFPKKLLNSSRVDNCQNHILQNIDQKIQNHNQNIQLLARSCYTQILKSPCKSLPVAVISNPICNELKKEIKTLEEKSSSIFK